MRVDARVGDRHRTCSKPECQAKRVKAQQGKWRKRNPEYFVARRILEKVAQETAEIPADPPVLRSPLDRLPWDLAQTEFGPKQCEFIACLCRVLVRHAQTEMRAQEVDSS